MRRYLTMALRISLLTMVLLGIVYPLVMTGLGQLIFPYRANGSLLRDGAVVYGSTLVGQPFIGPGYFHPRPSAAGSGYGGLASSGSNLGPTSKALHDRVAADVQRLRRENPGLGAVPVDMVTTSGSGLDPDITPANAYAQVARVARTRGMTEAEVRALVKAHIHPRQFGVLGEPRINVLEVNRSVRAAMRHVISVQSSIELPSVHYHPPLNR